MFQMSQKYKACRKFATAKRRGRGFTLVEILIVVVILGILAAIVVPHMSNAALTARENMLRDDLRFMRNQIALYRAQHHDHSPGAVAGGAPTAATFVAQMTSYSDDVGNTSAVQLPGYPYGPYLSAIPRSPLSDKPDVMIVNGVFPAPDDSTGWIYNPVQPEMIANQSGNDQEGTPFTTY